MNTSINLVPIKKGRLTITTEAIRKQFGTDTLYIFAIRLNRVIVIGRLDGNQAPEEAAASAMAKFGEGHGIKAEVYTLNEATVNFSKKWLEEAGRADGDLAFSVVTESDPEILVIEFLGQDDLLLPSVRQWAVADQPVSPEGE